MSPACLPSGVTPENLSDRTHLPPKSLLESYVVNAKGVVLIRQLFLLNLLRLSVDSVKLYLRTYIFSLIV